MAYCSAYFGSAKRVILLAVVTAVIFYSALQRTRSGNFLLGFRTLQILLSVKINGFQMELLTISVHFRTAVSFECLSCFFMHVLLKL